MNYKFVIQTPYWYYIVAILIAGMYALVLYQKEHPWSKGLNYLLALARAILVFLILFILSSPLLKLAQFETEKPVIGILIDNSSSVYTHTKNLSNTILKLQNRLNENQENAEYQVFDLNKIVRNDTISKIKFNNSKTNLNSAINNVLELNDGKSISSLILFSDGNFNQGMNPLYMDLKFPVYTVGLGDTTQKSDIYLSNVQYNKTTFLGNKYIIKYMLNNIGFQSEDFEVNLKEGSNVLYQKQGKFNKVRGGLSFEIQLNAIKEGNYHYVLNVVHKKGEITFANNEAHIYFEIVKSKDKILLYAQAPHPDVKAIYAALNANQNFEVEEHFVAEGSVPKLENVSAVFLFGIPNKRNLGTEVYQEVLRRKIPCIYALQAGTDINKINSDSRVCKINIKTNDFDKVFPSLSQEFDLFDLNNLDKDIISQYPPVGVPFASYQMVDASILLQQKIGNAITNNPVWVLGKGTGVKNAVILGDGIWMWRLLEKSKTQISKTFDEIVLKTVQYVSSKEEQKKFKVIPVTADIDEGDNVGFKTEIYNDLNQLSYNQEVTLMIKNEGGKNFKFKYLNQESLDRFDAGQFTTGNYTYEAYVQVAGKNLSCSGRFTIKRLQLEELKSVANHNLLRELSINTKGRFIVEKDLESLMNEITQKQFKGKSHYTENFLDIIQLKSLFLFLLMLISIEWILRKYNGGY